MYYRLQSKYALRGWKGTAWVLVIRPYNETQILSREMFQALVLCDGVTDLTEAQLGPDLWKALTKCEAEGYIQPCETPQPLEKSQYYQYHENRFMERIFWSVTGRCNFRCRHCYMDAPDGKLGELSTEEALNLIDQMAACGVLRVDLTGGEALVRKDFWQLVDRILSHHMVINQLYTNGWLLDESVLDAFESRGIKPEFIISYDGTGGWHDWMRGRPGAEEATLRAMRLCARRGFYVSASMCVHRGNLSTLPQTVETLRSVGVEELSVANVDETDLWRAHSEGNAMTLPEYMEAMLPYVDWYYKAGRPIDILKLCNIAYLQRDQLARPWFTSFDGTEKCLDCYLCSAVRWTAYITPEGRLLPCMPMTASPEQGRFPKVQDIGLQRGLSDSYYMQFVNSRVKDLLAVNQECAACEHRYKCGGGCRASALCGPDHSLLGCDRHMCTFWKNGYEEKIMNALRRADETYGNVLEPAAK